MLCTIMIPTRKRSHHLPSLIDNINNSISDKTNVEIVFRCDDDDISTIEYLKNLNIQNVRYLVGPRGTGYAELHVFYNEICRSSDADWFFLFNDDASIESKNWDIFLSEIKEHVVLEPLTFNGNEWQDANIFPIVHRKIYEALGHFSPCNMNDDYISKVSDGVNLEKKIDFIKTIHLRGNWHDQTAKDGNHVQGTRGGEYTECLHKNLPIDVEKLKKFIIQQNIT